ncbi:MAG: methyltransferase domain-containing protein [Muribaculaceae bacterium]|nr:methyltransferase domain-containing protein [Muribaculaceae bacterium]
MNDSQQSNIHDFDFSLICEYFSSLHRQGPGSEKSTAKALSFLPPMGADKRIADIGCGTGASTEVLHRLTEAQIVAVDLFPDFINHLKNKNLGNRIDAQTGDMTQLTFADETFDAIWSEGAIYNIGFGKGLSEWRRFLKPGGIIAVTDASWLTLDRPSEIADFWQEAYPSITDIASNIRCMEKAGYRMIATFVLPEDCWQENFYHPARRAQEIFLRNHPDNPIAEELVRNQRREAALYQKYHQYYGYVWYIGKKL